MAKNATRSRSGTGIPGIALAIILTVLVPAVASAQNAAGSAATDDPDAVVAKVAQLLQGRRWVEATDACRAYLAEHPDHGQLWLLLGYAHNRNGERIRALAATHMASEFEDVRPMALYNLACISSLMNQPEQSIMWLRRAHAAGFDVLSEMLKDPDLARVRADESFGVLRRELTTTDAPVLKDQATPPEPGPPEDLPPRRQFDFLVGGWNYFSPATQDAGATVTQNLLNGNMIVGNWVARNGNRGKTISFYNAARQNWFRVSIDADGSCAIEEGGFRDGAVRLKGRRMLSDGETLGIRSTITPLSRDRVRHLIEISRDFEKTWTTRSDEVWVRRGRTAGPPGSGRSSPN